MCLQCASLRSVCNSAHVLVRTMLLDVTRARSRRVARAHDRVRESLEKCGVEAIAQIWRLDFRFLPSSTYTSGKCENEPYMTDSGAPRVTVIIPTFNAAKYVVEAVNSALASRDVEVEVIAVDDGSTDDTWRLLESFDARVRRLRQDHGGPYRARNLGAREARGEWLAFLDADDDWTPDKLAKQLALADEKTSLIYTDRLNFGELGRLAERQSDGIELWDGDIFEPLLRGNFITLSSVLMRKTAFDKLGGFQTERTGVQDWDMWLRVAGEGLILEDARRMLKRRLHPRQWSKSPLMMAQGAEKVIAKAAAWVPAKRPDLRRVVQRRHGRWLRELARAQLASGEVAPQETMALLKRALRLRPLDPRVYGLMLRASRIACAGPPGAL